VGIIGLLHGGSQFALFALPVGLAPLTATPERATKPLPEIHRTKRANGFFFTGEVHLAQRAVVPEGKVAEEGVS
jgi:hypothetical protein